MHDSPRTTGKVVTNDGGEETVEIVVLQHPVDQDAGSSTQVLLVLTYRSDDGGVFVFSATNSKTRADVGGTYATDDHDVTVTMTSGYPAMNVTYVLR